MWLILFYETISTDHEVLKNLRIKVYRNNVHKLTRAAAGATCGVCNKP